MSADVPPRFKPVADCALLVAFAEDVSDEAHARVLALDRAIGDAPIAGLCEVVPAIVNLLVVFDPLETDHARVEAAIRSRAEAAKPEAAAGARKIVQVCYEPPFAPDLEAVASAVGLSVEAVINAHAAGAYHVLMYGFAPGYAYLSGTPAEIRVPRKPTPVRDVAAGSVIIAGPQCLVTTLVMPTGWSVIGRSPTEVLTDDEDAPFLFDVGDEVAFERVDLATYEAASNHG